MSDSFRSDVTFGSVCSGIEAASVAWHPLGWRAAWVSEIEAFPCAVLAHHYPDVPNLGDMTALPALIAGGLVPAPDVFCGGTPCQAFSVAGLRNSLDDARGNLSLVFCEIANAIDDRRDTPCVIFWENVPGVLSTNDNAFGCFLTGLAGEDDALEPPGGKWSNAGVVYGPRRTVAWRTLDAQYFGLAQRRKRVFVVASARTDFDPVDVLFECEGVRRDTAPSRGAGEAVAPSVTAGASNGGPAHGARSGSAKEQLIVPQPYAVGNTLTARMAKGINTTCDEGQTPVLAHALRGEGFDASEDGTGRGTPLVPVAYAPDVSATLVGRSSRGCGQTNSPGHNADQSLMAFHCDAQPDQMRFDPHASSSLTCSQHAAVATAMQVRRLTPRECERLQGFPDDYTLIPHRNKPAADGPRYKALGNSWAVPVVRWIGHRIATQL